MRQTQSIIQIKKAVFEDEKRVAVYIPKQADLMDKIKKIPNRRWSPACSCWHFPYCLDNWQMFKSYFSEYTFSIDKTGDPIKIPAIEMIAPPRLELKNENKQTQYNHFEPNNKKSINLKKQQIESTKQTIFDEKTITESSKQFLLEGKIVVRLAHFWKGRLRLDFQYTAEWVFKMKQINGHRWHPEYKCWSLPHSPLMIDTLKSTFGDCLYFDLTPIPKQDTGKIGLDKPKFKIPTPPQYEAEITKMMEKMILARMSHTTIKNYKNHLAQFLYFYNDKHPADISKEQIIQYMLHRIQIDKISPSEQNNIINAIKCYFEFVLGRERTYYDLPRPKKPFQLPNVLSQEEVVKLINAVDNIKHKCILLTIYSGGLRLSELTNLRLADIRRDDNAIFVKGGKGKKDRYTVLSSKLIKHLDIYCQHYKPDYWLFEGDTGGQYSNRSVQNILRAAVEKSQVNPYATVHTLRHSFATHMVLKGENLHYVQKLLGHESPETTEIYLHLTGDQIKSVKSPLDGLNL